MRLLFAMGLVLIIGGCLGSVQSEDAEPVAPPATEPAPAAETNPVAEKMAIAPALHEKKYWELRLDICFFRPVNALPPVAMEDPNNDDIPTGHTVPAKFNQDNDLRPTLLYNCTDTNTQFEINYLNMGQTNKIGLPDKGGTSVYWIPMFTPNFYARATAVDSSLSFRYIEANFLMRHSIKRNDTMNYFADWGLRWVQIKQHFRGNFTNVTDAFGFGAGDDDNLDVAATFNGAGLAFSVGFEYCFWNQFTLRGRFGGALLQGSLSGSFSERDTSPQVVSSFTRSDNALVPELESGVNLNWNPGIDLPYKGQVSFNAGYEMKNYFQVTSINTWVDDIHTGNINESRTSFGVAGYVIGVQFIWMVD
jgi:hypothetical protein